MEGNSGKKTRKKSNITNTPIGHKTRSKRKLSASQSERSPSPSGLIPDSANPRKSKIPKGMSHEMEMSGTEADWADSLDALDREANEPVEPPPIRPIRKC